MIDLFEIEFLPFNEDERTHPPVLRCNNCGVMGRPGAWLISEAIETRCPEGQIIVAICGEICLKEWRVNPNSVEMLEIIIAMIEAKFGGFEISDEMMEKVISLEEKYRKRGK